MATYTRQSSFSDGDSITAALFNDEFNQLVNTFHVVTGHSHDGTTAGDGGPISVLFSNTITIGKNENTDIALTFNATSNDGVLTWMEDEDYFLFSDDILLNSTEKLQFRDAAIYINSSADGQLDIVADTEIQLAATTIDINGAVDISGALGIGGGSTNGVQISQGAISIKNGGTQSYIDFYCEASNAHYARLQAPAHGSFSGNPTLTLPATAGTIALTSDKSILPVPSKLTP